jgi:hypothetical protein
MQAHRQEMLGMVVLDPSASPRRCSAYECGQQLPDLRTLRLVLAALHVSSGEFGRHLGPWGGVEPRVTLTVHR